LGWLSRHAPKIVGRRGTRKPGTAYGFMPFTRYGGRRGAFTFNGTNPAKALTRYVLGALSRDFLRDKPATCFILRDAPAFFQFLAQ